MSGGFPNNFKAKIETALKLAANQGVLLINDDGRVWSLAMNRQNRRKIDTIFEDAPHTVIGCYECDGTQESRARVRELMVEDCVAIGVEI